MSGLRDPAEPSSAAAGLARCRASSSGRGHHRGERLRLKVGERCSSGRVVLVQTGPEVVRGGQLCRVVCFELRQLRGEGDHGDIVSAAGLGRNKKEAEQRAARKALEAIENLQPSDNGEDVQE